MTAMVSSTSAQSRRPARGEKGPVPRMGFLAGIRQRPYLSVVLAGLSLRSALQIDSNHQPSRKALEDLYQNR